MVPEDAPKIGILLTRGPETPDAAWAVALARSAAARGWSVQVFLMHDGAHLLRRPVLGRLDRAGVRVMVCTQSVVERGLPADDPAVDYAGQVQLGRLISRSDRFLSFS